MRRADQLSSQILPGAERTGLRRTVHVAPFYRGNPYQAMLYADLSSVGAVMVPVSDITGHLVARAGSTEPGLFHLHWTNPIVQPAADEGEGRQRLDAFIAALDAFRDSGGRLIWTIHNVLPHDARYHDLEIELVDLDGGVVAVEAAMTKACDGVFAMVGGGYAMDNLEFSGKPGSDFHECGLIDIPGFAVSVEKSLSNGQVQPIPNPTNAKGTQWIVDLKELYPEESKNAVVVYSKDLPSLEAIKVQWDVLTESVGGIDGLRAMPSLERTPAVVDGRVLTYETQYLLGFGPRTGQLLRDLIDDLHAHS